MGNVFAFVGSDIQGRYHRLNGYDVFEPIGFDAFGMHSENFALKMGTHPVEMVPRNIDNFRENQLKRVGNMYDWDHEVDTTSPDYYRWTQWIFPAAPQGRSGVPAPRLRSIGAPVVKPCLAAEQVIDGACERCSTDVTKKEMAQWFFKTTAFAQKLLDNLEKIDCVGKNQDRPAQLDRPIRRRPGDLYRGRSRRPI